MPQNGYPVMRPGPSQMGQGMTMDPRIAAIQRAAAQQSLANAGVVAGQYADAGFTNAVRGGVQGVNAFGNAIAAPYNLIRDYANSLSGATKKAVADGKTYVGDGATRTNHNIDAAVDAATNGTQAPPTIVLR